jgi:hypothetical protein
MDVQDALYGLMIRSAYPSPMLMRLKAEDTVVRNGEMFPEGPRKDGDIFAAAAPAAAELVGGDAWLGEKLLRSLDL